VFEAARRRLQRVVYAEGEDERVLRAVQTVVDEHLAEPILVGSRAVIDRKAAALGLRIRAGSGITVLDPVEDEALFGPLTKDYQTLVDRRGVPPDAAARRMRTRLAIPAAMLLKGGHADAALVGGTGDWSRHLAYALPIVRERETTRVYALSGLILQSGALFICDTHVNYDPTAEQIAEMTLLAAEEVRRFGVVPKAALLSHSSFGSSSSPSARKMRRALALIRAQAPDLQVDGEMHADAALSEPLRDRLVTGSPLEGAANLLVMPTLDAANIGLTLLGASASGLQVGPMLLGLQKPLHVLVQKVTARGIVNMTALAAAEAGQEE
jgi:malate dehydrogenase (oxaloacetate-decarboxylating)(NADP+)